MKKIYRNINLNCTFQQSEDLDKNQCLSGLFSKKDEGNFFFEEVLPKVRYLRNAKLFDGKYLSMVRMKNGKLQIHMRMLEPDFNPSEHISGIFQEITNAFNIIK